MKTPKQRFEEIAPLRVNNVLENMDRLKRFAVRSNYVAEPYQLEAIVNALQQKVDEIATAFKTGKEGKKEFELPIKPE
jgi:hypothetical protein